MFFLITLLVVLWLWSGVKKLPIGWRGQLTFLGIRIPLLTLGKKNKWKVNEVGEGWKIAPFPFGITPVDTREKILDLGMAEFKTKDNVTVKMTNTITYRVIDLYQYLGVEKRHIEEAIDEKRTEVVRCIVREHGIEEVLSLGKELGDGVKQAVEHEDWGIDIKHVVTPQILPDAKTDEDLALKKREELQREGQKVELQHFIERVNLLMQSPPSGAGLTREQAVEQVQLAIGKASKTIDAKTISLDAVTAEALAKAIGRK